MVDDLSTITRPFKISTFKLTFIIARFHDKAAKIIPQRFTVVQHTIVIRYHRLLLTVDMVRALLTVKLTLVVVVQYIIQTARSYAGELTVIALGPLTNIAKAIAKEPMLLDWIKDIVVMGGAIEVAGNVTSYAEFNIYDDPHAANAVFSSGIAVKLIGLDVCRQTYVAKSDGDWFSGKSVGELLAARVITNWFKMRGDLQQYDLYDPLTIVCAISPELFTYKQATVIVEADDNEQIGQTRASYGSGNVQVATEVRSAEAKASLRELLRSR